MECRRHECCLIQTPWHVQVSDVLADKFGASQKAGQPGKSAQAGPPPLQELFSVGQLVRCSILALHDKDSSNGVPD